jgi:hypothetical protein
LNLAIRFDEAFSTGENTYGDRYGKPQTNGNAYGVNDYGGYEGSKDTNSFALPNSIFFTKAKNFQAISTAMQAAIAIMAGLGVVITIIKRILSETMPRATVIMTHSALGLAMPKITTISQGTRLIHSL